MKLPKATDTPSDSPLSGQHRRLSRQLVSVFDAARRSFGFRVAAFRTALRRELRANSLVHVRGGRISVGIHVGDIGLGRLDSADVGA